MKTRSSKLFLLALVAVLTLLLSACQVNFITDINKNGSGLYTQEIGFEGDEASMAGLSAGGDDFCASQNPEVPPGTTIRQETRDMDETWCVYETPFDSIDDLRAIYLQTDTRINAITLENGTLTYDITLDLSSDSTLPTGADLFWTVSMPGQLVDHNASQQDGNTLTWTLLAGQVNDIYAVSEVGGLNFGAGSTWIIVAVLCLCTCILVVLVVGGVVFFVLRRNKKNAPAEKPVETPTAAPEKK